jgi:hypothetical protein
MFPRMAAKRWYDACSSHHADITQQVDNETSAMCFDDITISNITLWCHYPSEIAMENRQHVNASASIDMMHLHH